MPTIQITQMDGTVLYTFTADNATRKMAVEAAYKAGISFEKANLGRFVLNGIDLSGANFTGAFLNGA